MGEGINYWARHQLRVQCPDFKEDLAEGLLTTHLKTQHGVVLGSQWETPEPPPLPNLELQKYRISFPNATGQNDFPVDGSQGRVTARIGLHVYFLNWYVQ